MKALLQHNIWQEHGYDRLESSLREHFDVECVGLIPFTENLVPDQSKTARPDVIFGSNRFVTVCRALGYPVFPSFDPGIVHYEKDRWINNDGITMRFGDLKGYITGAVFVKPFREKFFTGRVLENADDVEKLQLATSFVDNEADEMVMVSPPRNIRTEIRFYVVGGSVVSGSVYKTRGINKQFRVDQSHPAWLALQELIRAQGAIADAFVCDMGEVEDEWKIVELNNLNSAGIYECDTDAIARAVFHLLG